MKSYIFRGKRYRSLLSLYNSLEDIEISYVTFAYRINERGMDIEDVISIYRLDPHRETRSKPCYYNGVKYTSVTAMLDTLGISGPTYYRYMRGGLTSEESIEKCLSSSRHKSGINITYDG